jgi:hypothetical protein
MVFDIGNDLQSAFNDGYRKAIEDFIQRLDVMSGTGNGIGKTTVEKIKKFAEKEGYLKMQTNSATEREQLLARLKELEQLNTSR